MSTHATPRCLIVGAGLAGLMAAHTLQEGGVAVTVLEAAAQVGGRLATEQVRAGAQGTATFDHGAQYFTVRSARFRRWAERWLQAGVVVEWSTGFAAPDASAYRDGHPRYRGRDGMAGIAQHLAEDVDVRLQTRVHSARYDGRWALATAAGDFAADVLLLTPPVPQTLALLDAGRVALPVDIRQGLQRIDYDPCLALLAVLDGPSNIPPPGGLWPGGRTISWMADNAQKGISELPAVTIHGSPEFSREHYEAAEEEVTQRLLQTARPWLGAAVVQTELRRWRYSIPVHLYPEPCLFGDTPGPVAFAGDAFAGPRVEGAALSGLAAADAILKHSLQT